MRKMIEDIAYSKDHAFFVIDNFDKNTIKYEKFTCSIDTALLIVNGFDTQEKIDNVMITILEKLSEKVMDVIESKGPYTKKNGEETPQFRTRKIKFSKMLMAYHNRNIDGSIIVKPHFHFLFPKNYRLGSGYTYLRRALSELASSFNVQFHFSAVKRKTGLSKNEQIVIENMAMTLQRGSDDDVLLYLMDDKVERALFFLDTHFTATHNISYFIKQISIIHNRLRNMDISMEINGVDLKDEIYFYLTKSQHKKLMLLKKNQVIDLDLLEILDREILTYAYGFRSNVMDVLMDFFQIDHISKENLMFETPNIKLESKKKVSTINAFRKTIRADIVNALAISPSLVKFKHILKKAGYISIDVLKKKVNQYAKKEVAFRVKTKKHMIYEVSFMEINLNWGSIKRLFIQNRRQKNKAKQIESQIKLYVKKEEQNKEEIFKFAYRPKEYLRIIYDGLQFGFKPLFLGFDIQHSAVANITTYLSDELIIVDYADRLELKKCDDIDKGIDAMLRFLPKNVKLEDLDINLKGSDKYIAAFKNKLKKDIPTIKTPKKLQPKRKPRRL